jgi:hypothetical protein
MKIMSYSFSKKTINKILITSGIILIIIVIFYIFNKLSIKERFVDYNTRQEEINNLESKFKKTLKISGVNDLNKITLNDLQDLADISKFNSNITQEEINNWFNKTIKVSDMKDLTVFLNNLGKIKDWVRDAPNMELANKFDKDHLNAIPPDKMNNIIDFLTYINNPSLFTEKQIQAIDFKNNSPKIDDFLRFLDKDTFNFLTEKQIGELTPSQIDILPNLKSYLSQNQKTSLSNTQSTAIQNKIDKRVDRSADDDCTKNEQCYSGICDDKTQKCRLSSIDEKCKIYGSSTNDISNTTDSCLSGKCDSKNYKCMYVNPDQKCRRNEECWSNKCDNGKCTKSLIDKPCNKDIKYSCLNGKCDSKTKKCTYLMPGDKCNIDSNCITNMCNKKKCIGLSAGKKCNSSNKCSTQKCDNGFCAVSQDGGSCVKNKDCDSTLCQNDNKCYTIKSGTDPKWTIDYCNRDDTKVYIHSKIKGASNPAYTWYKNDQFSDIHGGTACCRVGIMRRKSEGLGRSVWGGGACSRFSGNLWDACFTSRDCKNRYCSMRVNSSDELIGRCAPSGLPPFAEKAASIDPEKGVADRVSLDNKGDTT